MNNSKSRGRKPKLTSEQAAEIRKEYCENQFITFEYLADKYDVEHSTISQIIGNKLYFDPDYTKPETRKVSGKKKSVYIPNHIQEWKDSLVPIAQTAHRARGQNYVINKFH